MPPAFSGQYWALSANVIQALVSWGVLLVLVRLGTEKDVGVFAYIQALLTPIQLFFTLKLRTVQCSDAQQLYLHSSYHGVRKQTSILCVIFGAIFLAFFSEDRMVLFSGFALLLSYAVLILRESYISIAQFGRQNKIFFFINATNGLLSLPVFLALFWVTNDLLLGLAVLAIARAFSYAFLERAIFSRYFNISLLRKPDAGRAMYLAIWKSSWPLGVAALMGGLFTSLPRFAVKDLLGFEKLAIYATLGSLLVVFNLLVNSAVQTALPALSTEYLENKRRFYLYMRKAVGRLALLGVVSYIFAILFGKIALHIVFGPSYAQYSDLLMYVVSSGISLALFSIGNLLLSSQRSFFIQFPIYTITAGAIWIFSYYLVPEHEIRGAFMAQIAGYIFGAALCWLFFVRLKRATD